MGNLACEVCCKHRYTMSISVLLYGLKVILQVCEVYNTNN